MNIQQDTFEKVVGDVAQLLDQKHAHVKTVTGSGEPVQFRIGLAIVADALLVSLRLNGITVGAELEEARAVEVLKRNSAHFGVTVESDDDAVRIKRVR
jgi:hypothetical protein